LSREKFPYSGVTTDVNDGKHIAGMKMARGLYEKLVEKQTHPDGRVFYGRPIGYALIRKWIPNPPPERTLRHWIARLRENRYIATRRVPYEGIIITILRPKKWARRQLSLFPPPEPVEIPVQKPVGKLWKSQISMRPEVAAGMRPEVAAERSKTQTIDKSKSAALARGVSLPVQKQVNGNGQTNREILDELAGRVRELARKKAM
jgi:hypothetical protein